MEMFLTCMCVTVLVMGVAVAAFGAATRSESPDSAVQPELPLAKTVIPAHFFSDHVAAPRPVLPVVHPSQVPIEVLLLQLENHVRLEQAAAASYVEFPTRALLHSKTTSPFMN